MNAFIYLMIIGYIYCAFGKKVVNNGMEYKRCKVDFVANHMALNPEEEAKTTAICEECMDKYNVTLSSIKSVEMKKIKRVTMNLKCYYACYFKTYGSMDEAGNFLPGAVNQTMSQTNIDAAVSCIPPSMVHKDHCERAFYVYSCYVKKNIDSVVHVDDLDV